MNNRLHWTTKAKSQTQIIIININTIKRYYGSNTPLPQARPTLPFKQKPKNIQHLPKLAKLKQFSGEASIHVAKLQNTWRSSIFYAIKPKFFTPNNHKQNTNTFKHTYEHFSQTNIFTHTYQRHIRIFHMQMRPENPIKSRLYDAKLRHSHTYSPGRFPKREQPTNINQT